MANDLPNAFQRALAARSVDATEEAENGCRPESGLRYRELVEAYNSMAEAMAVRKKIDSYLGSAEKFEEISALLLTVITAGLLFGYNRTILLLQDNDSGVMKGHSGIGTLSPEETWYEWELILREELELDHILGRAIKEYESQKKRLSPLLERLVFPLDLPGPLGEALRGSSPVTFVPGENPGSEWLGELLKTAELGIIPLWGAGGLFGVLLVDNFASGKPVTLEGLELVDSFARPFVSALERAHTLDRYRERVADLQQANARIEAQHEMLVRLERKNIIGKYSAEMAHNLLNPMVSMMGHLGRLGRLASVGGEVPGEIEALRQDVRELETFLGDFAAQIEEQFPDRHFWDLNHLISEVLRAYRNFRPTAPFSIRFEEGEISLVLLAHEKVSHVLARLMGVMEILAGSLDSLVIATGATDSGVLVTFTFPDTLFDPDRHGSAEGLRELENIAGYLASEQITLSWSDTVLMLEL